MSNFLKIVDRITPERNGFAQYVDGDDTPLDNLYNLRNGKILPKWSDVLASDFDDVADFKFVGNNTLIYDIINAYYHRSLCAAKALSLWSKYKRIYYIDPEFFRDFVDTEEILIDFSLFARLPYSSFYLDLSGVELLKTKHYQNVIGVVVNILSSTKIHIVLIDADNEQYNPIRFYGYQHAGLAYFKFPVGGTFIDVVPESSLNKQSVYGGRWRDFLQKFEPLPSFPQSWNRFDTGKVHFVDFLMSKDDSASVLKNKSVAECFGWFSKSDNVISINDISSPVVSDVAKFVIQFLYFLHSKTNDIREHIHRNNTSTYSGLSQEISSWDIGCRYGERIRSINKKVNLYGTHILGDTRNRPRPYVRSAHWHNYWVGTKGNQSLEPRWIEPVYCNGSATDIIATINDISDADLKCSTGEMIVAKYLDNVGIDYEKEYTVNIKGHLRRYDFRALINNKPFFIEFDGEQHFHPVEQFGGVESFKNLRVADFEKNKYARKQHIPLLRIRFDQKGDIPNIIDSFFEKPDFRRLNPKLSDSAYYR